MILLWTGLFLLAASWLPGVGYYHAPQAAVWLALLAAGCGCLVTGRALGGGAGFALPFPAVPRGFPALFGAALLALPAIVLPWPHRAAPLALAAGLLAGAARGKAGRNGRWAGALGEGLTLAGLLLGLQALALLIYQTWTSYSHELPAPLPWLLAWLMRLFGMEAAAEGTTIHLFTMRQTHPLGATWELLLPPATWCFLVSGLAWWSLVAARPVIPALAKPRKRFAGDRAEAWRARWRHFVPWAAPVVLWLPLRAALLAAWLVHHALLTEYEEPLHLMWPFWSTGVLLAADLPLWLAQAVWLGRSLRDRAAEAQPATKERGAPPAGDRPADAEPGFPWRGLTAAGLPAALAAAAITLGVIWDPVGQRKGGRIAMDEFHSTWEPSGRAFDTEWYGHLSGYNYWCIYDHTSRFYTLSRIQEPLTDAVLNRLDVLVLKVPTEMYRPEEVSAVGRFVERGGGLLLIGEHTDVFGVGYGLNQIARQFGFEYRYDCVFGVDSFFDQYYTPPFAPHPAVRAIRGMDFATSCSIRPFAPWRGRSVITSTGLKNAPADYHASNFYPQAQDRADMRYGAFVQLWSARHGRGRVLAFTDSTIFSNFCTFEPGKLDLLRGMLEWLNHENRLGDPRWALLALGAAAAGWAVWRARRQPRLVAPLAVLGGVVWAVTTMAVVAAQARSFQLPAPERPLRWVTIDRTLCDGPLSKNGFIEGKVNGFGIFERWILRLGYFLRRESGPAALADDLVVFFQPNRPAPAAFVESARRYVENGGHLLVLDSLENTNSTSGALLASFRLGLKPHPQPDGKLEPAGDWPAIPVQAALEVTGGTPLARLHGRPVAARTQLGRGTVTVLGIGARFTDARMGVTGDIEPDAALREVYEFQFRLLRWIVEGKSASSTPARPEAGR